MDPFLWLAALLGLGLSLSQRQYPAALHDFKLCFSMIAYTI